MWANKATGAVSSRATAASPAFAPSARSLSPKMYSHTPLLAILTWILHACRFAGPWAGRKVVCAPCPSTTPKQSHAPTSAPTTNEKPCPVGQEPTFAPTAAPTRAPSCAPSTTSPFSIAPPPSAPLPPGCDGPRENEYVKAVPGIGGWGGSCTCPDGQVYQVGDLDGKCGSLACYGGVSGECLEWSDGPHSHNKVRRDTQ